jgi:hypothetical protein
MNQAGERETAPESGSAGAPAHMRWDTSQMESCHCDLATSSATRNGIVLNFGVALQRLNQQEIGVELLRRIALSSAAAQNLAATLRKLIDEYDARSR